MRSGISSTMECIECTETFFGRNTKFCSMKCYKKHLDDLNKRVIDAVGKNSLHSKQLSDSQ